MRPTATRKLLLTFAVLLPACLPAPRLAAQAGAAVVMLEAPLPPECTLPIHLMTSLTAGRTRPGTLVQARLTQRVPVSATGYLKSGTVLHGTVVVSAAATATQPATLTVRLDTLQLGDTNYPLSTSAVAIANFVAVEESAVPCAGAFGRGNPDAANWTTCQVGGEQVVRSGWSGPVIDHSTHAVGFADYNGVYGNPSTPGAPPHALGVFSTSAHGLYGFSDAATLRSASGTFTLQSPGRLTLRPLDNLLLRVDLPDQPAIPQQ